MSNKFITLNYEDGVRTIILDRPERKNALCTSMYQSLTRVLNEDALDDNIVVTIITGSGSFFSSGNDLKAALSENVTVADRLKIVRNMVNAFINYPKLLIAVVNGPAIGIGATMTALCDVVYATDKAVFDTPFVNLGLCAEAASSFAFPFILGRSKASEMLLLGHKLSAEEAFQFGLVSKVIPQEDLKAFIKNLRKYGKLPVNTVKLNKSLIMANFKAALDECNYREMDQLRACIESEEFGNAMSQFLNKKSKL